MNMAVSNTSSG